MSQTIFKSSVQPLQNGLSSLSYSHSQNYHVPHSFSPKPKETPSKSDHQKSASQTRTKKLSFLLSPNSENPLKLDDDPTSNCKSIVSFHTPSKSSGEMSKKFIQLKGSASSNQLGFELFNSKDLVRLAMSKAKSKETTKKERVRTPNNMSNIFKKPQNNHGFGGSSVSEKVDDLTHSFVSGIEGESGAFRGTRPSTSDKAAKLRRLHQIYNEGSPVDSRTRQAQSIMHGVSHDTSHQFFHHSLSPPNHSVSKMLSPGNMTVALSSEMYKLMGQSSSTRHKASQEDSRRHKAKDEENSASKTPSSERFAQLNKVSSTQVMKTSTTPVNKFNYLNAPLNKERGRSPNSRVRKIALPFENTEDNIGKKQSNNGKDSLTDLEYAVNNLVRTCEQSLEPHPRNKNMADKLRVAQENVLERIKGLSRNDDHSQANLDTVLKEKKAIEGELCAVKQENEELRARMKEMCQRFKANKMKSGKEKIEFVENVPSTKGETSDTGRATSLRKIINHQQRVIQDLKRKEDVVKKVLDMAKRTGMHIDDFSSSENAEDENKEGCSVPGNSTSDLNQEKLTESEKMEQAVFQWNMEAGEVREMTEREQHQERSIIRVQNADQEGEMSAGESDDKMVSGIRESEDGTLRQRLVKPAYSDAKSTADSAGLSTRKQTKGRRSLSSKLKNKLKLDLTRVTGSLSVPKYNIVSGQSSNDKFMLNFPAESGKGFHEEFMSRFEEFSQSWRQAALNQKF